MPAQRPRAAFEPIPPDFDLKRLVETTANFSYVDRISCDMIDQQGMEAFERLVTLHVIVGGKPLVIDGFEDRLDPWTFNPKWLRDNCGDTVESARNLTAKDDIALTMAHYLKNMALLTNQFFDKPGAWRDRTRQRVYLKDIDCPDVWWEKVREHIPSALAYLNDSTGEIGGAGAVPDHNSNVQGRRLGKGIARAGDLMSSLPPDMRAENLMCYVGHEGTYTPSHREMCASLGQNIMVEASNTVSDDGTIEKPGSSIWFMTESKDRHLVSEYWLSVLGHDIEVENHFAQVVAWKKAPFSVYVVEQRPGDFILIPPLAPHQVWNRGTRTMKVAWNRTTVETLEMALNEALPRSRIVCRDEQYKNKAIIYYTLQKYASLLSQAIAQATRMPTSDAQQLFSSPKIKQLKKDFKRLFIMYKQLLLTEMFNPEDRDAPKSLEYLPFDSNVTCAYCRGNIFNRFLTCGNCKGLLGHNVDEEEGDPYDICMDCYAMGRSCACISGLKWVEQFRWKELASKYDIWRRLIIQLDGNQTTDKTPLAILEERRRYGKKTLAEVCKDQLKRRPFKDVKKSSDEPKDDDESDEEIIVGDDGQVKKIQKKKSKSWLKNNVSCHVCCHRHPTWKTAKCTTCERSWCYGSLFRGWDKMPMDIMQDQDWSCPHCLGICFAGACKREGKMTPYEPKGTLLGHDTKKVADVRSVEALVDFSHSNLNWLKDDDPANRTQSRRFQKARAEAEKSKNADPVDEDDMMIDETQLEMENVEDSVIDPALGGSGAPSTRKRGREDYDTSEAVQGQRFFDEDDLARRLQQANSSLSGSANMTSGVLADGPHGYAALGSAGHAGYNAPRAQMYPLPDGDSTYVYPGQQDSTDSVGTTDHGLRPFKKQRKTKGGDGDDEDDDNLDEISMQKRRKQKRPFLGAGFRSVDLAGDALGAMASKARNDAQRQFEIEKERKALEKAKTEGRFIRLQAALKGKKRIVKLGIPGSRLAQLIAQQTVTQRTANTALNDDAAGGQGDQARADHEPVNGAQMDENSKEGMSGMLLTSDVAPKKTREEQRAEYEEKKRNGIVISGNTKKARIPIEKDENYNYSYRARLPNGKRGRAIGSEGAAAAGNKSRRKEYEEVDVGSEEEDDDEDADSSFVAINSTSKNNRRSLPGYLRTRHEGEARDVPIELPGNVRDINSIERRRVEQSRQDAVSQQLQHEIVTSATSETKPRGRPAGKRPGMRPQSTTAEPIHINSDIEKSDDDDADDDDDEINSHVVVTGGIGRPSSSSTATGHSSNRPKTVVTSTSHESLHREHAQSQAREAQRLMDEENRLVKLQALEMLEADLATTSSRPQYNARASGGLNAVSMHNVVDNSFDEDESDDVDEVPARPKRA